LIGDKAYTNYSLEDDLFQMMDIALLPKRRKNLTRQHSAVQEYIHSKKRNIVETVFSVIVSKMPRQIKARTERGFVLKIIFFILAYLIGLYLVKVIT
jgi:Transposase DDE domain